MDSKLRAPLQSSFLAGAVVVGLSFLFFLPTRSLVVTREGRNRPGMVLPHACHASKIGHPRGMLELSLSRELHWVSTGHPGEVRDLAGLFHRHADQVRAAGCEPSLRLRIPHDAPATYLMNGAKLARRDGFTRVFIAVQARPQDLPARR